MPDRDGPRGVAGWLLLLSISLTLFEPLTLALALSGTVVDIASRGAVAVAALAARLAVTAFGMAAGVALFQMRPHAVAMARTYFVISTIATAATYFSGVLPNQPAPGLRLPQFGVAAGYNAAWYLYLSRSARVRNTFA